MKIFHIADLHLGKKLLGESLAEDQEYILKEIVKEVKKEQPQIVLIAGDIYDKSIPSTEAVVLLDDFLQSLAQEKVEICMISGNHDSAERLEFARRLLKKNRVHVAGTYHGVIETVRLSQQWGDICIYLLPFLKPAMLRPYSNDMIESYEEAVKIVLRDLDLDKQAFNILLAHQYVACHEQKPITSDSEQLNLGGLDEVDVSCFADFDYVALGHIHRPQKMGRIQVRYAGSPLKYSFSEVSHKKAITVLEISGKEECSIRKIPLKPKRDMAVLKDGFEQLLSEKYEKFRANSYVSITITDEKQIENPVEILRKYFPGMLDFSVDNMRTRNRQERQTPVESTIHKTPQLLFNEFYEKQNHVSLSEVEKSILEHIFQDLGEMEL